LGTVPERAECEILNSNLEQAAGLVETLLIKARSKIDHAEICRLRIMLPIEARQLRPRGAHGLECLERSVSICDSPTRTSERNTRDAPRPRRAPSRAWSTSMMDDPEMQRYEAFMDWAIGLHADLDCTNDFLLHGQVSCRHGTNEYSRDRLWSVAIVLGPAFHPASQTGRHLRGWRRVANDTGSPEKAGAHFLMQMAVLWTRHRRSLTCLEAAIELSRKPARWSTPAGTRNMYDLMRAVISRPGGLESASALDSVRKYKFGPDWSS